MSESLDAIENFTPNEENELGKEIVYGPSSQEVEVTFWKQIQDYYICIGFWIVILLVFLPSSIFLLIPFIPNMWIFGLMYLVWLYYDRDTPHNGGRRCKFLRKLIFWRCQRDYFPIKLVKTADLPPDTTYLFSSFPHGAIPFGASTNFVSDVNNFDQAFPGLNPYIMALNGNFYCPITRDFLLGFGMCAASKESIRAVLNGPPGNVCVLIVGGIAELLLTQPRTNRLVLKRRKGFVKLALEAGSSLVPVFTFGETDTYNQLSSEWYLSLQSKLRSTFGIGLPIMKGRALLCRLCRIMPHKCQITTVVGKPIKLPKEPNPSEELIDQYHQVFIDELTKLFHKYKDKYDVNGENVTLSIE